MPLRPWSRFLKVAALGDAVVVDVSDGVLGESYRPWLFGLAGDVPGKELHLDCDGVRALGSRWMATLLMLNGRVRASGGKLRLLNLDPQTFGVLRAVGLAKLLDARVRRGG